MQNRYDQLQINGREYRSAGTPIVVVCIDGSELAHRRDRLLSPAETAFLALLNQLADWPAAS